jgi:hypothetical protein
MRRIEFTKAVVCDGKPFAAGAVVDETAVPPDHLATCLRLGFAREHVSRAAPEPEPPADPTEGDTAPAPAPKPKKK